jgi:hypothetical protein
MSRITRAIRNNPKRTAIIAIAFALLIGFILYWFEPQALLIDKRIDEEIPAIGSGGLTQEGEILGTSEDDPQAGNDDQGNDDQGNDEPASEPELLASGTLRGINHSATGDALLIRLADGSHILRFENLEAENGPDLRVYLSEAPATSDGPAFNDNYVELGPLKGNIGNQNYAIPGDVDLSKYPSAVIWCKRFEVGFAVAGLD